LAWNNYTTKSNSRIEFFASGKHLNKLPYSLFSCFWAFCSLQPPVNCIGVCFIKRLKKLKRSPLDIPHDLALNEVLIAARHLEKFEPRDHLSEARHEWMLRQETFTVTLYRETQSQLVRETVRFTPDGFLDFRITIGNQTQQACILLELDMDTHQKPRFQKKIASYVAFINEGLYEQHFQTTSVVICFVTPTGDKRREQMKLWCVEQLVSSPVYRSSQHPTNGMNDASLFLFGAVPPGALNPRDIFLSPIWYAPFDNQPQSLLVI